MKTKSLLLMVVALVLTGAASFLYVRSRAPERAAAEAPAAEAPAAESAAQGEAGPGAVPGADHPSARAAAAGAGSAPAAQPGALSAPLAASNVSPLAVQGGAFSDPQKVPAAPGEPAVARVRMPDGKERQLVPNQVGAFERVLVQPRERVAVTVHYPQGEPGQKVVMAARDGGDVGRGQGVQVGALDAHRNAQFDFTVGANPGSYQVEVRKGRDVKVFRAWAGPELILAAE